jgi:hypothetical protein
MVGGSILGISAATIGGAIGTALGSTIDAMLHSRLRPARGAADGPAAAAQGGRRPPSLCRRPA